MNPQFLATALLADPDFPRLKEHVISRTGLAYYADKDNDLARRVASRLQANLPSPGTFAACATYLALLLDPDRGALEFDALVKELTIGETFFFRHTELFDALRTVILPGLIARNREQRRLRIWSAGATGAEPYSLSILLQRDLQHLFEGGFASWDVTLIGTDINRDFLSQAQEGCFGEWALRTTPPGIRDECFTHSGSLWQLRADYRDAVCFQYHNLVLHPFPSLLNNLYAFDLILCRNVMIYFSQAIVRTLLEHFRDSLVAGGWLLVGHAEPNVTLFQGYRAVNAPGAVLYQKFLEQESEKDPLSQSPLRGDPLLSTSPPKGEVGARAPFSSSKGEGLPGGGSRKKKLTPARSQPPAPDLLAVRSLADCGQAELALAGCEGLLQTDRLNPLVHFYHGLVLEQLGRHPAAEDALRRAIYLDRRFPLAHYYLGLLLHRRHDDRRASRSFQNAFDLLTVLDPAHVFPDGDGITAGELARLTRMHLEILEGP